MNVQNIKLAIKKYWSIYLLGFIILFGLKYYYSNAGSDELKWILTPLTGWVRILSGIPFVYDPKSGYVNHNLRFIIAPSCSGISFMLIAFATLLYSFVHRMKTRKKGFCFTALSLIIAYLYTVFVNGMRIVISIYLPLYLSKLPVSFGWLTPKRIHTIIGIVIYFTSLCILYRIADSACPQIDMGLDTVDYSPSFRQQILICLPPMFWYFAVSLGIPLLRRAYRSDLKGFIEYAGFIISICMVIIGIFGIHRIFFKRERRN